MLSLSDPLPEFSVDVTDARSRSLCVFPSRFEKDDILEDVSTTPDEPRGRDGAHQSERPWRKTKGLCLAGL